ncbi:hypothetical protein Q9L58_009071, partial [Maublancomyces gigas]
RSIQSQVKGGERGADFNATKCILSLRHELASTSQLVNRLEQELQTAHSEHEATTTLANRAQQNARNSKQHLQNSQLANEYAIKSVEKERDDAFDVIATLKGNIQRLTKSKVEAENIAEMIKWQTEEDRMEFIAKKRVLEHTAHIAQAQLKALMEGLVAANAHPILTPPPLSHIDSDVEVEDIFDSENGTRSPSLEGRCLADELQSNYYQECIGDNYKNHISVQVDNEWDPKFETPVDDLDLDITEKLTELAVICANVGWKTIRIYMSAEGSLNVYVTFDDNIG